MLLAKETADKSSGQYFQILSEEAKLALECHDYERMFSCCQEVVRSGRSHDGIIYLTLGHTYEQLGNYSKSLENYKIAFAQTKSNNVKRASLFSLATLEYSVGHFAKSEQYVNSYIEMSGLNDKMLHLLACCYFRQSKYQELELLLSQVKENYPHLSYAPELDILLAKGLRKKFPRIKNRSYSTQQLIHYQKNVAIEHISKNHRGDKSQKTSFAKDIDIEKL